MSYSTGTGAAFALVLVGCGPGAALEGDTAGGSGADDAGSSAGPENSTGTDPDDPSTTSSDPDGDSTTTDDEPPPDGGLGDWGFGFESLDIDAIWVVPGDFDGNGRLDLLAGLGDAAKVYTGDGAGGFVEASQTDLPESSSYPQVGDFDGDGDIDFLVISGFDDMGAAFINNGDASFEEGPSALLEGFHGFGTRPLNYDGDGIADLFIPRGHSNGAYVAVGVGDGTFAMGPEVPQPACYFSNTSVADLDGDGLDDVVATGSCNSIPSGLPLATYRRIAGTFTDAQGIYAELGPVHEGCDVETLDIDADDDFDVVTATDSGLYVVRNGGNGTLEEPPQVLDHEHTEHTQRVVALRLEDEQLGFVLEGNEGAALVIPDDAWTALTTELVDLQGRVAFAADFDMDERPDLVVLDDGAVSLWLSAG